MTTLRANNIITTLALGLTIGLACDRNRRDLPGDDMAQSTGGAAVPGAPIDKDDAQKDDKGVREAEVDLVAAEGKKIDGEAKLEALAQGVKIVVEVEDAPAGAKGIHIHEKGDCSNIAGKSMGEHFAPDGHDHALPNQGARHLGDLGNIEVGENGKGRLEITVDGANLKEGDPRSFLGKSLIIHETADKGSSEQPSGGSGTPIACGVIKKD